jgi:monofunctional biosynthetic peptidoglycan transglycosylase
MEENGTNREQSQRRADFWRVWLARGRTNKIRLTLGLVLGGAAIVFVLAVYQAIQWPDVRSLESGNPTTTAFIERYRSQVHTADQTVEPRWRWVPYDSISPHLKRAVLVAEDIGFFSHGGFEVHEIKQAVWDAVAGERSLRGASTITQQLAKNLWLTPSRSPIRKLKEAALTYQLERHLSKKRILELYLNVVEFGPGVYGAEAASRHYFGKPAADLSVAEAARLAAGLPRPARWNPASESPSYRQTSATIEERMDQAEFLWRRI